MDALEAKTPPTRRWKKRRIFGVAALALLILLAIAWLQRERFADSLIRDQLDAAGVKASYEIKDIGLRTQRLENVVLGDPANPDLTARVVEVDVAIGFGKPVLRSVRATGVRLRGAWADGKLRFGELDKFMQPESKEPFRLPDFSLELRDSRLSLGTPWGGVGVALSGSGHLRNSFNGQVAVAAPKLAGAGCIANGTSFSGKITTRNSQPAVEGPLLLAGVNCPDRSISLAGASVTGKLKLSEILDNWVGDLGFAANNVRFSGQQLSSAEGKVNFYGSKARTNFDLALAKAAYRGNDLTIAKLAGDASGRLSSDDAGLSVSARGNAGFTGAAYRGAALNGLGNVARGTQGTPVGPIMAGLDPALRNALQRFEGGFAYDSSIGPGPTSAVSVSGLAITSHSGARIRQVGGLTFNAGRLNGPVALSLSGGGLPAAEMAVRQQGNGWSGTLALSPYASDGASISVPQLAFSGAAGRPWRFQGQAVLTGPLLGGRIEGLSLPVDGSVTGATFSMLSGCRDIRFSRFQTGSLNLPRQSFRACARNGPILSVGGGETRMVFTSPAIAGTGTLGSTPLAFKGGNIRFDLDSGFAASNVSVDLGRPDALTQFTMANLSGRFGKGGGLAGELNGGAGQIGNVPLLIEEASGNWGWNNGVLTLDGLARVSDAEQVDRFKTLAVPSMQIALEEGVISAIGYLAEPKTGIRVADVDIKHQLNNSTGRALLAVDGLYFGDRLQPSDLTPLTVGAIANVEGSVSGDGIIEWDAKGVRSRGKFGTSALDFAAAFGPVKGLSTEVNFTDLLGLETGPSQVANIEVVNPGVPAIDGKLIYHLLPDQKVKIEGGRWPFYGGELILEPTILDFDVEAKRELTFRLIGLDAEKFFVGFRLDNVRVSGIFDGTLPMVFDQEGGRIVGGWLVSRPGGGEVSYLGQLSYKDMGAMANFAFEALRSIRFDDMQVGVEGSLGGELITEVRFRGLQQGSGAKRNFITKQLAKLPIQFNVRIKSEFMTLFSDLIKTYDGEYAVKQMRENAKPAIVIPGEGEGEPQK